MSSGKIGDFVIDCLIIMCYLILKLFVCFGESLLKERSVIIFLYVDKNEIG